MDTFDAYRARPGRETLVALLESVQDRVYNLCYQVLRHPEDAQDAAQQVLMSLVDALPRISDAAHLAPWLHRAAFHVSIDLKKTQKRRREREARVAMSEPTMPDEAADEVHHHVSRLEDELRTLVVEHYFEQKALPVLAGERGCSTVAVWKKLERAREKLRDSLSRAGYASAVPVLESFLSSLRPVAAPEGLLSKAVLAKAAAAAVVGGLAMKAKTIAAVAVLVLGAAGATAIAVIRQRDLREREIDLQAEARAKARPSAPAAKRSATPAVPPPKAPAAAVAAPEEAEQVEEFKTQQEFADAFRKAAAIPDEAARWKAFRRIGFRRTPEQFRKVEHALRARPGTTEYEREFTGNIMMDWLATDVKGCVEFMMRLPMEPSVPPRQKLEQMLLGAAQVNREGALAYAQTLTEEEGRSDILKMLSPPPPNANAVLALGPGSEREAALQGLLRDWGRRDPRAAAQWVEQLSDAEERAEARTLLATAWGTVDVRAAAAWVKQVVTGKEQQGLLRQVILGGTQNNPKGAIDLAVEALPPELLWSGEVQHAIRIWSDRDPAAAARFLQGLPEGPKDRAGVSLRTTQLARAAKLWAMRDPSAALEWAEKLGGAERTGVLAALPGGLVKSIISNPREALSVIERLPEADRPQAICQLVDDWAETDPRGAADFARSRPELATKLDEIIALQWAKKDFQAAFTWAKSLPAGVDKDTALQGVAVTETNQRGADRGLEAAREIQDAGLKDGAFEQIAQALCVKQLDRAIAVAGEIVDPQHRKAAYGYLVGNGAAKDPAACLALLSRMPDAGQVEYGAFASGWAQKDPRAATAWAEGLSRPELREWTLYFTFPMWVQADRSAAEAWVTRAPLPDVLRQKLFKLMPQRQ